MSRKAWVSASLTVIVQIAIILIMFTYTTKDKMPEKAVYLTEEAQVYGELYLGSTDGLVYLDEEKRGERVNEYSFTPLKYIKH